MDRREVLRATATITAGALIAGCTGGQDGNGGDGAVDGSDGSGDGGSGASPGGGTAGGGTSTRRPTLTPPENGTTYPGPDETVSTVPDVTPTTTTAAVTDVREPDGVVTIRESSFDPVRLAIDPGDVVRWVNEDDVDHAVESEQFHAAAVWWGRGTTVPAGGATQLSEFADPGIYEYRCSFHGRSTGCGVVLVGDVSLDARLPCE